MTAAFDALPDNVKRKIEGLSATHNFERFWEMMRQRGGAKTSRAPMTEEQKRLKPPVSHPPGAPDFRPQELVCRPRLHGQHR